VSAYALAAEALPEISTGLVLGTVLAIVAPMAVIGGAFMAVGRIREQLSQVLKSVDEERIARQDHERRIASLERWRERVRGREEITGVHSVLGAEKSGDS